MDRLKSKAREARNRLAQATSSAPGTGELPPQHQSVSPQQTSSTDAVDEGQLGREPGTHAQDFGAAAGQQTRQPAVEPPTSLQSSIDAGSHVPKPSRVSDPSSHVTYKSVSMLVKKQGATADIDKHA